MRRFVLLFLSPLSTFAADDFTLNSQPAAPLVDHHQHLVAPEMAAAGQKPIDAAAMISMLDAAGIRRAVLLSNAYRYADYEKVRSENDWTANEAAKYPQRLVAFCGFDPLAAYALEELARCAADERFGRGIKLQFGMSAVNLADAGHVAKVKSVFSAANEKGLAIVVHMRGRRAHPYGAAQARTFIDELLAATPDVPVQIAHFAGGGATSDPPSDEALATFIAAIAKDDPRVRNLYFDLALVAPAGLSPQRAQFVVTGIRQIGLPRILYGSDGGDPTDPPPEAMLEAFRKLPLTGAEFRAIGGNVAPYLR
jgi:predicted TIM-barrel fold metal-dependent hydrolase